ncbi:MAG: NCS1 family nucleobase:cation symporter-1, partial [Terriglobales bacterium]
NTIVLAPILLNSHAGTKYGIPFPVLARASYGVRGSNVPALMRAVVACGWFGINAWIGGQALQALFVATVPGWSSLSGFVWDNHSAVEWLSFIAFWFLNLFVIYHGMDLLQKFVTISAPFVFTMTGLLAIWTVNQAHGFGALVEEPGKFQTVEQFLPVFIPSVTAMIGSWATLSLNMPDFTRFSRDQKSQMIGQIVALPASMTIFSGLGIVITSAAMLQYPHLKLAEMWDPVKLISQFPHPWLVATAMFTVMLATLSVNIAANIVSPANDLANCFPRWISFKRGVLLTGIIGLLMQPWKLMADPQAYIFTWLLGYAGGLGSIAGVMIVDYWIIRKKTLPLADLYLTDGAFQYSSGWNWRAVIATIIGCAFAWIGVVVKPLHTLYDYSWFVGLGTAALSYWLMMKSRRA